MIMNVVCGGFKQLFGVQRRKLLLLVRVVLVGKADLLTDFADADTALDQCFGRNLVVGGCVHIRCCGNGGLWFRSYSGSLLANAPKVTKRALPHHSVPRLGSACPHSGSAPRAAATGHPWPGAAKSASLPIYPLHRACLRPSWLTGPSDQDQDQKHGGLK